MLNATNAAVHNATRFYHTYTQLRTHKRNHIHALQRKHNAHTRNTRINAIPQINAATAPINLGP
jgi:hypothetical protein